MWLVALGDGVGSLSDDAVCLRLIFVTTHLTLLTLPFPSHSTNPFPSLGTDTIAAYNEVVDEWTETWRPAFDLLRFQATPNTTNVPVLLERNTNPDPVFNPAPEEVATPHLSLIGRLPLGHERLCTCRRLQRARFAAFNHQSKHMKPNAHVHCMLS